MKFSITISELFTETIVKVDRDLYFDEWTTREDYVLRTPVHMPSLELTNVNLLTHLLTHSLTNLLRVMPFSKKDRKWIRPLGGAWCHRPNLTFPIGRRLPVFYWCCIDKILLYC